MSQKNNDVVFVALVFSVLAPILIWPLVLWQNATNQAVLDGAHESVLPRRPRGVPRAAPVIVEAAAMPPQVVATVFAAYKKPRYDCSGRIYE